MRIFINLNSLLFVTIHNANKLTLRTFSNNVFVCIFATNPGAQKKNNKHQNQNY